MSHYIHCTLLKRLLFFLLWRVCRRGKYGYTEGFPDAEATLVLGNNTLFSGPEAPWHGLACVPTAKLPHRQNRWLHPNSLQGPRLLPAPTLAGHGAGFPDVTHTKDLLDDLVAELVLSWLCLCFAFLLQTKASGVTRRSQLWVERRQHSWWGAMGWAAPCSVLSSAGCGMAPAGPAGLTAREKLA